MPAHQAAICHELIHDYLVDGVELDFTADQNAFGAAQLADGTAAAVLDAFVAEVVASAEARAAGQQQGERCLVGARVYPTEEINLSQGMDVRQWLCDGLLDFVIPNMYADVSTATVRHHAAVRRRPLLPSEPARPGSADRMAGRGGACGRRACVRDARARDALGRGVDR